VSFSGIYTVYRYSLCSDTPKPIISGFPDSFWSWLHLFYCAIRSQQHHFRMTLAMTSMLRTGCAENQKITVGWITCWTGNCWLLRGTFHWYLQLLSCVRWWGDLRILAFPMTMLEWFVAITRTYWLTGAERLYLISSIIFCNIGHKYSSLHHWKSRQLCHTSNIPRLTYRSPAVRICPAWR
jgi:hypothetical protein